MTDMYVYYFLRSHGPAGGKKSLSKRRATLATINSLGCEPVMESQIVVDHTEVDGNGFLTGGVDNESHPADESWAQIRSLERRAHSRDCEALLLNETTDGARIYMLSLESRELRSQARKLRNQRAELLPGELGDRIDAPVFAGLGSPIAG
jgi:hypothetical protein